MKRICGANEVNNKGFVLTLTVFLVIVSVLALYQNNSEIRESRKEITIEDSLFNSLNRMFEQPYFDLISLSKSGRDKIIQSRALPFDYNLNDYNFSLRQTIPLEPSRLESFYDYVNTYKVFVSNPSITEVGLHVDLNISESGLGKSWLDTSDPDYKQYPEIKYVVIPQCIVYRINNGSNDAPATETAFDLLKGSATIDGCASDFSWGSIKDINVVVRIPANATFNINADVDCSGDLAGCPKETFNPLSTDPYVQVFFEASNQPRVLLTQKHITPSAEDWVEIQHKSDSETNNVVTVMFEPTNPKVLQVESTQRLNPAVPVRAVVSTTISAKAKIQEIKLWGVSLRVYKDGFDLVRYS